MKNLNYILLTKKYRYLFRVLSITLFVVFSITACSTESKDNKDSLKVENGEEHKVENNDGNKLDNSTENTEADVSEKNKNIFEQAVDWCNNNLFTENKEYNVFTFQSKVYRGIEFDFLLEKEKDNWKCALYSIHYDDDHHVIKVSPCGEGEKDLFTYSIVNLSCEDYVAVYCASQIGNGNLELFHLDSNNSNVDPISIDKVIDNHYELKESIDYTGSKCASSLVYDNGKLNAEYIDVNLDGYTDIVFSGIILSYESNDGDIASNKLTDSQNCRRTYLYNNSSKQFELSEETLESDYLKDVLSNEYTGYLDTHPTYGRNNRKLDYDGDGLLDRIYKVYDSNNGHSFYMYFGNGEKLLLSNRDWCISFKTEAADLTGDGVNEIIFIQGSPSTGPDNLYVYIYTSNENGKYEQVKMPYYENSYHEEFDGRLYLPLLMEKVNDAKLRIYQPDCGYQGYISTRRDSYDDGSTYDEMEHLYFDESEGEVIDYCASSMSLIETEDTGRKALLMLSYLGDKWCIKSVVWKLEYLEGEWKITNVYQTDPVRVEVGTEFTADLNGDKTEDTIYYGAQMVQEHGYDYEVPFLKINSVEYNYQYLQEKFGVNILTMSHVGYYILDIDISDSYREIAILDEGPSSDPETHFFRYTGNELIYYGVITDFPENSTFRMGGDGKILARKRLNILQTWWADATWKLNEEEVLEEQMSEFYYPYQYEAGDNTINHAKEDLKLFQVPDRKSASVTIKKGEVIKLTSTDNLNWIEITSESGTKGWFYFQEGYKVILPRGEFRIGDIVSYLNMAD
ncbi:MAG TPA: SH3 domain-containing protein [Mobilitalea sp.]|nr:SH3 domain-containing protein [Mobilitalea sp.]